MRSRNPFIAAAAVLAAIVLSAGTVKAQKSWVGTTSDLWAATNWNLGVAPTVGQSLTFDGGGVNDLTFTSNFQFGTNNNQGFGTVTLTGDQTSPLTITNAHATNTLIFRLNPNAGVTIEAGAGALTFGGSDSPFQLALGPANGTANFVNNSTNVATIGLNVNLVPGGNSSHTVVFSGSGDWLIDGRIRNLANTNGIGVSITKDGDGTLTLNHADNYYNQATTVNAGKLLVNGRITKSSGVTVAAGATLGGSGDIRGIDGIITPVDLSGVISPGASVGTFKTNGQTWHNGAGFLFEINDAAGGSGTGWDLLDITGALNLGSLSTGGFGIDLVSLLSGGGTNPGLADNFDFTQNYEWEFARTSNGITGFSEDLFAIDTDGFLNSIDEGQFAVVQDGNSLLLTFTAAPAIPEPSAWALAGVGALGTALVLRRRRFISP